MALPFDTHKFVRRLEQAGVPLEQAEVQAEVLTEAFTVNMESLVTKDYLDARLTEQEARVDKQFAAQNARIDANFRIFLWTQAIVMAAVIIPYFERMLAL
jgi:hypothetical protein